MDYQRNLLLKGNAIKHKILKLLLYNTNFSVDFIKIQININNSTC